MADEKITLKNVEVSWVKHLVPQQKYGSKDLEFSIDIKANDVIKDLIKSKKLNKTIKKDKERTFEGSEHITLKMDERTKNGWTRIPEVFDEDGNYFAEPIGNGSKMDVFVSIGESSFGPHLKLGQLTDMDRDKKTLSFALGRVVDLVYYESAEATQLKAAAEKSDNKEMEVALEDF